ncbi:MAG: DNA repair protein RadC [Chloroflexota bacterium]
MPRKPKGSRSDVKEHSSSKTFTVRDMPLSERPRERLSKFGAEALSAAELLAIILGRGVKGEPVTMTSQKLLSRFGSLKGVLSASLEELCALNGVGPAKAAQLKAALEVSRRLEGQGEAGSGATVKGPDDVVREVRAGLKGKKKEHFLVVLLDTRNHVIAVEHVSKGSLDSSVVHPREVFQPAIAASAASVILVHNHPSGDPQPSEEDVAMTRRLASAGELMGIGVLDHLIVCDSGHLSMKAGGLM